MTGVSTTTTTTAMPGSNSGSLLISMTPYLSMSLKGHQAWEKHRVGFDRRGFSAWESETWVAWSERHPPPSRLDDGKEILVHEPLLIADLCEFDARCREYVDTTINCAAGGVDLSESTGKAHEYGEYRHQSLHCGPCPGAETLVLLT
jgi:hypothetical protein